jgi:hypothetical protein
MTPTTDITPDLEAMIDRHGLLHVITALECICAEKEVHIITNWQDARTAKPWGVAARKLTALGRQVEALNI